MFKVMKWTILRKKKKEGPFEFHVRNTSQKSWDGCSKRLEK